MDEFWYELTDSGEVRSPALLVYPRRVLFNAQLVLDMAKEPGRLRPHIKTHKMAELIKMQLDLGISKFKCATLREAELLAETEAPDVLLAMQPVSNHITHYIHLIEKYPKTRFSTLIDNPKTQIELSKTAKDKDLILDVWIDINNGMDRTGIKPGKEAEKLYKSIVNQAELKLKGLHVYDGHIHDANPDEREINCNEDFKAVVNMKTRLESEGYAVPSLIAGGTPTFPIHAKKEDRELSPGTPFLWDAGYGSQYRDLKFKPAAVLLTRIVSKPGKDLLCFDLGHKSVASEMKLPRVRFLGKHDFEQVSQSEEHLVVKNKSNEHYAIGDSCYVLPLHICPTVSKYPEALTVEHQKITGHWAIGARDH